MGTVLHSWIHWLKKPRNRDLKVARNSVMKQGLHPGLSRSDTCKQKWAEDSHAVFKLNPPKPEKFLHGSYAVLQK